MRKSRHYKYQVLAEFIKNDSMITMSFSEIEKVLGKKLPSSAYSHRSWWANQAAHVQADAWMSVGMKTYDVILGKKVTFKKNS